MILRNASLQDASALAALGRDSFSAAFEHLYVPEYLSAFLDLAYGEQTIAREIADPKLVHQLAQESDGLMGFCKIGLESPYGAYSNARNAITLAQLYTAPGRTGQGIGASLMAWALSQARQRGADAVQLSVWAGNKRAQVFYARYGLSKSPTSISGSAIIAKTNICWSFGSTNCQIPSNPDLAAQFDNPVGRQPEKFHRGRGVAQHPGKQPFTPHCHRRLFRRQ